MATSRARMRLGTLARVAPPACAIAAVFNVLTDVASVGSALQGALDALLITALVGGWLLFVRDGLLRARFRRLGFAANLAINGTVLVALFLLGRATGQLLTSGPARFAQSFVDPHLALALPFFVVLAFSIQLLLQMNRMIGANVLRYFATGAYHRPREEERIFLFLDLVGSTRLAERLGGSLYYDLLRAFVDDLSDPVVETGGEIYQYAGDDVVVMWRADRGLRDANCVRCFFRVRAEVARRADAYRAQFAVVPEFRGALHGGSVVAGELGDLKQQIVFVGDTLNVASRLLDYAKQHRLGFVASGALLERLALPAGVRASFLEELPLRGKEQAVSIHRVAEADAAAAG